MDKKTDLRIWAKGLRKNLDVSTKSLVIVKNIRNLECYKMAKHVMIFYPKKYEVNLLALLDDDKEFYLPRVSGENLLVCPYKKDDEISISDFNICEPCSNPVDASCLDLILAPALVVDKNNYRLGYGGGFYDRLLSKNTVKSIVPIPKDFVVECLPIEETDIPVDIVVTD